jgi:CBS-domain-containing membrane protein
MQIKDYMKRNVISVHGTATIAESAAVFVRHHIGVLPVVDENGMPIGILRLSDLLSLELPDFLKLVADVDFVHDFGAVENARPAPELLTRPVTSLMQPIVTVEEDCGLLRAYSLMLKEDLHDIPVTDSHGVLAGIVSRVDVGTAVLSGWKGQGGKAG